MPPLSELDTDNCSGDDRPAWKALLTLLSSTRRYAIRIDCIDCRRIEEIMSRSQITGRSARRRR